MTKFAEFFRSSVVNRPEYDQFFDLGRAFQSGDSCLKLVLADESVVGVSERKAAEDRIENHTVGRWIWRGQAKRSVAKQLDVRFRQSDFGLDATCG